MDSQKDATENLSALCSSSLDPSLDLPPEIIESLRASCYLGGIEWKSADTKSGELTIAEKARLYDILEKFGALDCISVTHRKSRKKGHGNKWVSDGHWLNYPAEAFDGEYSTAIAEGNDLELLRKAGFMR